MNRVIVFESVHQAIRAERILQKEGIIMEMIPTPREISASCGQSITFDDSDIRQVIRVLVQNKVVFRAVFARDSNKRVYELLQTEEME